MVGNKAVEFRSGNDNGKVSENSGYGKQEYVNRSKREIIKKKKHKKKTSVIYKD